MPDRSLKQIHHNNNQDKWVPLSPNQSSDKSIHPEAKFLSPKQLDTSIYNIPKSTRMKTIACTLCDPLQDDISSFS